MRSRQLAALVLIVTACDKASSPNEPTAATSAAPAAAPATFMSAATGAATRSRAQSAPAPASPAFANQKLIRTGDVSIQVPDVPRALRLVDSIARGGEALLADSRTSRDDEGKRSAEVVLRVPAERFAALLQALRGVGTVQNESVSMQDVTREYTDLETRLAVKEQTVARLRALLDTRTAKLADVLEVERELGRAVEELERMKGERRFFDGQIALSTLHLSLFERVPTRATQLTRPISDALRRATGVLGASIGAFIYVVVAIVPWALALLGVAWLLKRLRPRFLARSIDASPRS